MSSNCSRGVHFKVYGHGSPLMLGFPITASPRPGDPASTTLKGYLDLLTDRYSVLVMDYPNLEPDASRSKPIPAGELTAERVCCDLLAVADAAGFEQFIWWGFSWGGVIGLQLATRSDRVAALVCGGWPPLGAPYAELLRSGRAEAAKPSLGLNVPLDQFVTFYESIQDWHEADAIRRIQCPRMAFVGSEDEGERTRQKLPLAAIIREHRGELEQQGWEVVEITGRDHSVYADPVTVVPVVRSFLDKVCC